MHDMGAISIVSSDSQAMGRVGEVITRTWQTAHKMKVQRGSLPEDGAADSLWRSSAEGQANAANVDLFNAKTDNFRVKRYVTTFSLDGVCYATLHPTILMCVLLYYIIS